MKAWFSNLATVIFVPYRREVIAFPIFRRLISRSSEFSVSSTVLLTRLYNIACNRLSILFAPLWPSEVTETVNVSSVKPGRPATVSVNNAGLTIQFLQHASAAFHRPRAPWVLYDPQRRPTYPLVWKTHGSLPSLYGFQRHNCTHGYLRASYAPDQVRGHHPRSGWG